MSIRGRSRKVSDRKFSRRMYDKTSEYIGDKR